MATEQPVCKLHKRTLFFNLLVYKNTSSLSVFLFTKLINIKFNSNKLQTKNIVTFFGILYTN